MREEVKICSKCKEPKPLSAFALEHKLGMPKRRADCRSCVGKRITESCRRRRVKRFLELDQIKNAPCTDCGEKYPPYVMDFDHRRDVKCKDISRMLQSSPWAETLKELEKCDLVCANCHRLRTWNPVRPKTEKQALVRSLKDVPCADCGGRFHYSQMDFDHVRGEKTAVVPRLIGKPLDTLLAEIQKCDVVCANCHRQRTQKAGYLRRPVSEEDLLAAQQPVKEKIPWRHLVGTMPDRQVAQIGQVCPSTVWEYHKKSKIPDYKPKPPFWHALAGTMTDSKVAERAGISPVSVCCYRKKMGIPSYTSQRVA